MVYASAARKTAAFVGLALVVGFGITALSTGELDAPTGHVTAAGVAQADPASWIVFVMGMLVGALMIGTYFYLAHHEGKRH